MLISYDWLKDFVKNAGSAERVAEKLTMAIAEVEDIHDPSLALQDFVIGRVEKILPHPNADKLQLADVNVGQSRAVRVVCGAKNIYEGMLVIFAPTGSRVKWHGQGDWITLQKATIRREESHGMIAMAAEVGLDTIKDPENGVVDLSFTKKKPGTPLAQALGIKGTTFTIDNKALTHRADLFSHWGLAREYAAADNKRFSYPTFDKPLKTFSKGKMVKVAIENKKDCARFLATVMNVTQGDTPATMKSRLESVGVRSLNRIVDITNYAMLETGHPFHAFDYDKLLKRSDGKTPQITVRRAKPGEKMTTLDGKLRTLDPSILVVADSKGAVGIAGTMGGKDTEVDEHTTRVLLEVARFDPIVIRVAAQKLGLRSEASMRFEKGLPHELSGFATKRGLELFALHAHAKIVDGPCDAYVDKYRPVTITLDPQLVSRVLGVPVSAKESGTILTRLGMKVSGSTTMKVAVPWFRPDLKIPEDLVEEIARIKGYPSIPEQPLFGKLEPVAELPELKFIRDAGFVLAESGMTEARHYSFYGPAERDLLDNDTLQHVETLNALSEDLRFMRWSLFPQLVKTLKKNQRYRQDMLLFEFGHVFSGADELSHLALAATDAKAYPFLKLKGIVEHLFASFGVHAQQTLGLPKGTPETAMLNAQHALTFSVNNRPVGFIAALHPNTENRVGLDVKTVVACFDVRIFSSAVRRVSPYQPLPIYPAVVLDLAFTLPSSISYAQVAHVLKSQKYGILEKVELFDVYAGRNVPEGSKSLAFHLTFRSPEKTLATEDAQQTLNDIIQSLKEAFGITVRS